MTDVCRQVRVWCDALGRPDWFRIFLALRFGDDGERPPTQGRTCGEVRRNTERIRYALQKTEQEFARLLRAEVTAQLGSSEDVDAEIAELKDLL